MNSCRVFAKLTTASNTVQLLLSLEGLFLSYFLFPPSVSAAFFILQHLSSLFQTFDMMLLRPRVVLFLVPFSKPRSSSRQAPILSFIRKSPLSNLLILTSHLSDLQMNSYSYAYKMFGWKGLWRPFNPPYL